MTVLFKPIAVAEELRRLSKSARRWLVGRGDLQLLNAANDLEAWFQSNRPGHFDWTLANYVESKVSTSYQGQGNAHAVCGRFTFLWRCERAVDPTVVSVAKGGTDIEIYRSTGKPVNSYHFDLCEGGSVPPSTVMHCFSHAQFGGGTSFPRFPSMLLLPSDVLEMLLFELWPTDWQDTVDGNRSDLLRHHLAQRKRLGRMAKAFHQLATKRYPLVSLHSRVTAPIHLF